MSDNIKKIDLSTPGRILGAGDIKRKKVKLEKTLGQLENLQEGSKKYHRKMFKAEKTLDQLQSGRAGIQGFKMPYNMVKNNSAIKEVTTEEARRVPEYLPPRRIVKPEIVDDTYARNIQRNIEKHRRQDAMIEAERARELQAQAIENEFFKKNYEKPQIVQPAVNMMKNNSATPYKLPHQSKAAPKQTVSSSGGNDLEEFLKKVRSRKITNPEYADQEGPKQSKSYDFFITNRSPESDKVARQMDSLNKAVMEQAKNRQFDEMRKTREYQQKLMDQYNLD